MFHDIVHNLLSFYFFVMFKCDRSFFQILQILWYFFQSYLSQHLREHLVLQHLLSSFLDFLDLLSWLQFSLLLVFLLILYLPDLVLVHESWPWGDWFHGDWVEQPFDRYFVLALSFDIDLSLVLLVNVIVLLFLEQSHLLLRNLNRVLLSKNLESMHVHQSLRYWVQDVLLHLRGLCRSGWGHWNWSGRLCGWWFLFWVGVVVLGLP